MVASIGVNIEQDGSITGVEFFVTGFRDIGRVKANVIFGDALSDEDYLKIPQVDMSSPNFKNSLTSSWVCSDSLEW